MTRTGEVLGTPYYMSPEQCNAEPADHRSDLYSLGATYYTMLTGAAPYQDRGSAVQVMFAHCHAEPPDPRSHQPGGARGVRRGGGARDGEEAGAPLPERARDAAGPGRDQRHAVGLGATRAAERDRSRDDGDAAALARGLGTGAERSRATPARGPTAGCVSPA